MSKRPRDEEVPPRPQEQFIPNSELHRMIARLKERFVRDLRSVEAALADVIENGNRSDKDVKVKVEEAQFSGAHPRDSQMPSLELVGGSILDASEHDSDEDLSAMTLALQKALRSRAVACTMVDMVVHLQAERADLLRLREHLRNGLNTAQSILHERVQDIDEASP